jgi:hypothetical protein
MVMQKPKRSRALFIAFLFASWAALDFSGAMQGAAQAAKTEMRPAASPLTLHGKTHEELMKPLHVVRQYTLEQLKSNPKVTLGAAQLDFTPILKNEKLLPNIAARLHALPQHVQVLESSSDITEVDQGLLIHHVLSYQILPGKCSDVNARAQLESAGASCFKKPNASQDIADFSTKGSTRYVADPVKRMQVIEEYQQKSALVNAQVKQKIAELRKSLADPKQQAQILAKVGQGEMARLNKLNDEDLKEEVVNMSEQRFEETSFVPRVLPAQRPRVPLQLKATAGPDEIAAAQKLMHTTLPDNAKSPADFPQLLRIAKPESFKEKDETGKEEKEKKPEGEQKPAGDVTTNLDLGTYYYLTGSTTENYYQWAIKLSITISWCIIGCDSTYYVEPYLDFDDAFGLRFPIQADFSYHNVVHPNQTAEATVTADYEPIRGNVQDFESTGLPSDQLFNGKELVAQVGATVGLSYSLPVIGSGNPSIGVSVDLTDFLPSPYTGGIFQPPAPGSPGINNTFTLTEVDMLGDLGSFFGVIGAQVYPAMQVNLHSNKLQLTLNDEVENKQVVLTKTGTKVNVGVDKTKNKDSHFSIGNPVYNLGFTLTPGIDVSLGIFLPIWPLTWDNYVWFPELSIDLPPGGSNFSCHAGTTCVIDFEPKRESVSNADAMKKLESEGCTKQGSQMVCTKGIQGYGDCNFAIFKHYLVGVDRCNGDAIFTPGDKTLVAAGCQRINNEIGMYVCPASSFNTCKNLLSAGKVMICILPFTAAERASDVKSLHSAGCTEIQNSSLFSCPKGGMAKCLQLTNEGKVFGCEEEK